MPKKTVFIAVIALMVASSGVLAQGQPGPIGGVEETILWMVDVIKWIIWIIASTFTVVMFATAGLKFLTAQGDPTKIREARQAVIWGSLGVAVIILAWSAVYIVGSTLGVSIS